MTEIWKPVPDYEAFYHVSNRGRVRSRDRTVESGAIKLKLRGRLLRVYYQKGYAAVGLSRAGVVKNKSVHRLVMLAFVGPCPDGCEVLHGDGDRSNNRLENLRYGTASDNEKDKHKHGTVMLGAAHPHSKLTAEDVLDMRSGRQTIREVADRRGCRYSAAWNAKAGRTWAHI